MEPEAQGIPKSATRIQGLDEILHGGLPAGRTTLLSGGPGSGKSLLALEFLYRAALEGEPGVFVSFEESQEGIRRNARSLGWDLGSLEEHGMLFLMEGRVDPEAVVSGGFNIMGLMALIEAKTRDMGARRVVIDALDILTGLFVEEDLRRNQVLRLHRWLTEQGLTVVLTAKNVKALHAPASPYGYLDFMADCVVYLDQRIGAQVNTRRLQVIKYRGSGYGGNEYPFLITGEGLFFYPISDMEMHYSSNPERAPSGNPFLDDILGGGYQRGSAILVTGETGTGKTALASTFTRAVCQKGGKVLYANFEESPDGMVAGMLSLGIDLRPARRDTSLLIRSTLPESMGIEEHLYRLTRVIQDFQADHLVVDAVSAIKRIAGEEAAFDFLMRLILFSRKRGVTVFLINQSRSTAENYEISGIGVSSVIDTILTLQFRDDRNETRRVLQVRKSRGSRHSNKVHEFSLTTNGVQFHKVVPPAG